MKRVSDRGRRRDVGADTIVRDAELWGSLGISADPDSIRLGKKRVLSIDAVRADRIAAPEPEFCRRFDWRVFAAAAGLTPIETRLFLLHFRDGVPSHQLHFALKITFVQASVLYTVVRRKLGIGAELITGCLSLEPTRDSLKLAYRDKLPSGARPWALGELHPEFRRIVETERTYIRPFNQALEIRASKSMGALFHVTIEKLRENLTVERAKLARIGERLHRTRVAHETAEAALETAQSELKADQVEAVLQEHDSPGPELRKKLTNLQNLAHHAKGELDAAVEAERVQRETVINIESEIAARRHQTFLDASRDDRQKIRTGILELAETLSHYGQIANEHDARTWADDLFPPDPSGELSSEINWSMFAVTNAVAKMFRAYDAAQVRKCCTKSGKSQLNQSSSWEPKMPLKINNPNDAGRDAARLELELAGDRLRLVRAAGAVVQALAVDTALIRRFHALKASESGRGSGRLTRRSAAMFATAGAAVTPFELITRAVSSLPALPGPADQTVISGCPVPYNTLSVPMADGVREEYAPGCFGDLRSAVAMLFNHDFALVLGKTSSGTAVFRDSPVGVVCQCLPPDSQWCRDLLVSMARGDINQMSAGFYLDRYHMENRGGQKIRVIDSAKMIESSVVSFPSYPATSATIENDSEFLSDLGIEGL